MTRGIVGVNVAFLFVLFTFSLQAQDQLNIELKPCFIDRISEKSMCATVKMPLDHRGAVEGEIDLHVAIVPSLSSQVSEDPLVIFNGGPGQASSEIGGFVKVAFKAIREHRDIILIDQRGTGLSTPIQCDADESQDLSKGYNVADHSSSIKECRSKHALPVEYFTMENVVADTHLILNKLGYNHVNLWGVSWGTRTAVHYLRRYPEHVRSVMLDGVLPPDVGIFETDFASATRALDMLTKACNESVECFQAYGDVGALVERLAQKAREGNLRYVGNDPILGDPVDVKLDFISLVQNIRGLLYAPQKATMLPMALKKLDEGDGRSFVALISDGVMMSKSMYLGATLSLLCGEEVPRVTPEQAKAMSLGHFTRDSYHQYWSTSCAEWPSKAGDDDIHQPLLSSVPMLVLSGELDPVTPPSMGEHIVKSFEDSRHIIVNGVGHAVSYKGCMPKILGAFLKNTDVGQLDVSCLDKMKRPAFAVPVSKTQEGEPS